MNATYLTINRVIILCIYRIGTSSKSTHLDYTTKNEKFSNWKELNPYKIETLM